MRDIDIRAALLRKMKVLHNESDTLVVEELALCQGVARVDVAVVNGSLHGYEIKSERDTLQRLPGQRDIYNQCFEYVTIVVSAAHLEKAKIAVPTWWEVWCATQVDKEVVLSVDRPGSANGALVPLSLAQLLWRDEALHILEKYDLANGLRSKPRRDLWRRLASELDAGVLAGEVRAKLKMREGWRSVVRPV